MHALARWWHARRAGRGPHAALFRRYRGPDLVSLDIETTGLDPAECELLSLAAVPFSGSTVRTSEALVLKVRGASRIGIDSMRHHQLRPSDVADGVSVDEAVERLLAFLGNRPVFGYCIGFDIAVIGREMRRLHGFPLPNRHVELSEEFEHRFRRRHPELEPGLSFERIAQALGIPQLGRHDAYGDAVTAALCLIRLRQGSMSA